MIKKIKDVFTRTKKTNKDSKKLVEASTNADLITKNNLDKLNNILSIIDNINITDDYVHIKLNKNLVIENDAHTININKGVSVNISKEIHLNPKIDFNVNKTSTIEDTLNEAMIEQRKEIQNKLSIKEPCNH